MMNKIDVHKAVLSEIESRIVALKENLAQQQEGLSSASESTAGDKHNTSRAMMHIEIDKIQGQIAQTLQMKGFLDKIKPDTKMSKVGLGSLVQTNKGLLFLSIPLGKIKVAEDKTVMCISLASPLGAKLRSLETGDSFQLNGNTWEVSQVQ